MIQFSCVSDEKRQTAIFGQRRWHQTTTAPSICKSQNIHNCLFCIRVPINVLSENQKEAFRTPKLERTAEATCVISIITTVALIRRETPSERGRSPFPTGAKSHISTLSPSTRQQSDITQFYFFRKQLPTLNTPNSTLVGDLSSVISWECGDPEEALVSVKLLLEIGL